MSGFSTQRVASAVFSAPVAAGSEPQTTEQLIVGSAKMPLLVTICMAVLVVLVGLFVLISYRRMLILRRETNELMQDAEQLFTGSGQQPEKLEALLLDREDSQDLNEEDVFTRAGTAENKSEKSQANNFVNQNG